MKRKSLRIVLYSMITIVFMVFIFIGGVSAQIDPERSDVNERRNAFSLSQGTVGTSVPDLLINNQELSNERRGLILHYCDTILGKRQDRNVTGLYYNEGSYRYDPRQSLFVYSLCVNVDEQSKGRTIVAKEHVYRGYKSVFEDVVAIPKPTNKLDISKFWKEGIDLNKVWGIPSQGRLDAESAYTSCNPVTTMQSCNFANFLPVMFKQIMNEYSNMKLASIYGYKYTLEEDEKINIEKSINEYSDAYFTDGYDEMSPCNEKEIEYLSEKDKEGQTKHCTHPKTYKELEETIRSAERMINELKYLDSKVIMKEECDEEGSESTLHACAFANWGDISHQSPWRSFYNLYLNELMWYSIFIEYYGDIINNRPSYSPVRFNIAWNMRRSQREARVLAQEQEMAKNAAFQTIRIMQNVETTFPIHISLRAYREDLVIYRKQLAKSYTPLNQLYHKFTNVQACEE